MNNVPKMVLLVTLGLFLSELAFANLEITKLYKSAFNTDEKPKCITCHTIKTPKKEEGKHDWNDYGQALRKVSSTPTEATYKIVGKNEAAQGE